MSFLPEIDEDVEQLALDDADDSINLGNSTFTLDFANNRLTSRRLAGAEAVQQYLAVITLTPRGVFPVFSEDYGTEIETIIGESLPNEVATLEVVDDITSALTADPRTESVVVDTEAAEDRLHVRATVRLVDGADVIVERSVET